MTCRLVVLLVLLTVCGAYAEPKPESQFLRNVHQVTFEGRRSGESYFSRDGRYMVFQSEREPGNPFYQIYVMDLVTGVTRRVSPGVGKTTCSWIHPYGTRILFASTHLDPDAKKKQKEELEIRANGQKRRYAWDYDEHYDIFDVPFNGGEARNLTHVRGYDAEGSWSPDGKTIAYASNRHAYTGNLTPEEKKRFDEDPSSQIDIYRMDADGSNVKRLTTTPGYDGGPFFSPDGQRICWRHFSLDGRTAEIWTMNVDGSDPRQITHLGAMSWAPFYHPSGDYLIFATNLQGYGNFELYIVDAAGKHEPVRVTYTDGFDGLPVFVPKRMLREGVSTLSTRLAWTAARTADGQSQIFMGDWDDAAARAKLQLRRPTGEGMPILFTADGFPGGGPRTRSNDVEVLSDEERDGRLTGTLGEERAAAFIIDRLKSAGLQPGGDSGGWLQAFPFTAGVRCGASNKLTINGAVLQLDRDWRPLTFSRNGPVRAPASQTSVSTGNPHGPRRPTSPHPQAQSAHRATPATSPQPDVSAGPTAVFAGYGIVAPAGDGQSAYDSYNDLDVNGRWVVVFRFMPEKATPAQRQHLARFSNLRYKAMAARDKGALGLIVVNGPNAQAKEPLVKLAVDATLSGSSLPAISLSDTAAERLLAHPLKPLQNALDGDAPVAGFAFPARIDATIDIVQEKRTGHNVIGVLKAPGTASEQVVIGAHYDHLGHGLDSLSLAQGDEKGKLHPGADDNASGVAGLIGIAQEMESQRNKLKRDVVFAAWSGEELGLLGSAYYVDHTLGHPVAYLNMDMIGRMRDSVILLGIGSSSYWKGAIERANSLVALPLALRDEAYLPTDATSFYLKRIPVLSAFTGSHPEYHSPRDTANLIDVVSLDRITDLMCRVALDLATSTDHPEYRAMDRPVHSESRAALRAWLGTIPDYAQSGSGGLKISGVAGKGPAEAAGLKAGDIIVELGGRKIDNIYDYTYAIEALRVGVPVPISVMRNGQRLDLRVTPTSRE